MRPNSRAAPKTATIPHQERIRALRFATVSRAEGVLTRHDSAKPIKVQRVRNATMPAAVAANIGWVIMRWSASLRTTGREPLARSGQHEREREIQFFPRLSRGQPVHQT